METRSSAESVQMDTKTSPPWAAVSKGARIGGWIMSIVPVLMLLMSAVMKFSMNKQVQEGFTHLGWPTSMAITLGVLELTCTAVYLIPQTAVLGAILLTGYLGGAIATHVRIGENFVGPLVFGILLWGGLFLRDRRVRELIPIRKGWK